jgi:hypothetical protein
MSKKDFEAFAAAIRCINDADERATVARHVAYVCARANGRFDSDRFYRACEVQVGAILRAHGVK